MSIEEKVMNMAKPVGSLGLLEKYYMKAKANSENEPLKAMHIVFAANNGIAGYGVVKAPTEFTGHLFRAMMAGKATINQFCDSAGISMYAHNVGISKGTKNFMEEPAMTRNELMEKIQYGENLVRDAQVSNYNLLSFGEVGMANTTTSSAVLYCMLNRRYGEGFAKPTEIVGAGAGLDHESRIKKLTAVEKSYELYKSEFTDPLSIVQHVGGYDIACMVGAMLACEKYKIPFVIDGFIAAVSYLIACLTNSDVFDYAIPSHLSKEPGMSLSMMLSGFSKEDIPLHAGLALGEGTGAVLMVQMLKTIENAVNNTATIFELGNF